MGITAHSVVFYGVALEGDHDDVDGAWPEPYESEDDAVQAYLRVKLEREPTKDESESYWPPTRHENGEYYGVDGEAWSLVTTFEGGYHLGDAPVLHPFVIIRPSFQAGDYTGALPFDPARCAVDDAKLAAWRDALREFCDLAKLPWYEPRWYITASVD